MHSHGTYAFLDQIHKTIEQVFSERQPRSFVPAPEDRHVHRPVLPEAEAEAAISRFLVTACS